MYAPFCETYAPDREVKTENMKIAYVAGPYRAKTKLGIIKNIMAARKIAKELWKLGYSVICPHSNSGLFSGIPEEIFLEGDIEILKKCDVVVLVPGWENSSGTMNEIQIAAANNIAIFEWEDNGLFEVKINYVDNEEECI